MLVRYTSMSQSTLSSVNDPELLEGLSMAYMPLWFVLFISERFTLPNICFSSLVFSFMIDATCKLEGSLAASMLLPFKALGYSTVSMRHFLIIFFKCLSTP